MKISTVIVSPTSPGLLYPSLRIAKSLVHLGLSVSVLTGSSAHEILTSEHINFLSHELSDSAFKVSRWAHPETIVEQYNALNKIISIKKPDLLIVSQFCPAYALIKREYGIRLWVLGLATTLWPRRHNLEEDNILSEMEKREVWRYKSWVDTTSRAAQRIYKPPFSYRDFHFFYGDRFLIRNVPKALKIIENGPADFTFIGDCLYEPKMVSTELTSLFKKSFKSIVLVQPGRHFDDPPFWDYLDEIFLKKERFIFLTDMFRYDGPLPTTKLDLILVKRVPALHIAKSISLIVSSGGSTSFLIGLKFNT